MIDAVIDVSHFDGSPDWTSVNASGILGVIHKATQGTTYTDPTYAAAQTAAPAAGLLFGAYHFGTGDSNGAAQAQFFLSVVKPTAQTLVVIDFEPNPSGTTMTLDNLIGWVEYVQNALGRSPVIYGGESLLFTSIGSTTHPSLAKCPLWVAEYTSASQPANIPSQIWTNWTLWQYTDSGTVSGISTAVDRNRYNGTADQLTAWWNGS